MVNIPLMTMDEYGILEPTDVGTMTIDCDSKDDPKRKISRWDQEEVLYMLKLIKENNFISKYSVLKMSSVLSQLLQKKGYKRTDKQIQMKLTMLRKNYLTFERQKAVRVNPKECPFYKELRDVYETNGTNGYDSDEEDATSQDECLIRFPNDPMEWTKEEVQKMLNFIKSMKLKNELSLTFFSPVAVRMVAESMMAAGYDRSTQQVKNALINLRTMYVDYKVACDNNENPEECIFYPCLDLFWGREFKRCRVKDRRRTKSDDSWSVQETIMLLTLIKDLNIVDEAYKNVEKVADEIRRGLGENGYVRSKQQIVSRLIQLKVTFVKIHTSCDEAVAVHKFPFYNIYKNLFEKQYTQEILSQSNSSDSQRDSLEYSDFCAEIKETSQTPNASWKTEEVRLLLKTIQEITSKSQLNNSLEDEKLQKLVKVLSDAGYHKTPEQIKRKLALLKESYLKCHHEGSTKEIFDCPFYNELHNIFHTSVSDTRYEFIQNLLAENLDLSTSKFSDHSYTNIKCGNGTGENRSNDKVTVVPNKCLDTWYPVESIIDDDGMSPSTTLGLNNISEISNKEQEQVVEDAILATLPNSNDKIEINHTITEEEHYHDVNNSNDTGPIPSSILNDIAIDQEVETTNEESNIDYAKIYHYDRPASQMSVDMVTSSQSGVPACEEDGPPPSKRPRIIEDEKIGKNKILLRPMDGNPSSLNISKPTSKFVRLIVANDRPSKSNLSHITAHIEPLSVNAAAAASSVASSGLSSPVDRADAMRLAAEKAVKEDVVAQRLEAEAKLRGSSTESCRSASNCYSDTNTEKISQSIKDAVQTMMNHEEVMQQKHHAWMEKQFEIQRKHEDEQKHVLVKELQELRKCIAVLLASKQPHANSQHR